MGKKKDEKSECDDTEHEDKPKGMALCQPSYPHRVFLIIASEFCERFCFYGMKAVLQTYLMLKLGQDADTAATLYHTFAIVAYFTPLPGAILADSFLGRYWTIVSLSIVYVIGNIVMATTAIGEGIFVGALIGMFTIAIGTGGIKPCVSSFGADQFTDTQKEWQKSFFSMFYISVNAGALISMFVTPLVKGMSCFGEDECWVLAFGLPAALMVIALVLFMIGTPWYRRVPVTENVVLKMCGAVYRATVNSFGKHSRKTKSFMDRAVPEYTQEFVDDCKAVFRVLVVFLPLPFFWALYDQQGSRWTLQAQKCSTYIDPFDIHLEAEQIQILNAILVIAFVPVFDTVFYPCLAKCNLLVKPLQRMIVGCTLVAVSFVIIGIIQLEVNNRNDNIDVKDIVTYRTRVFNQHPQCAFDLYMRPTPTADATFLQTVRPYQTHLIKADSNREGSLNEGSVLEFTNLNCTSGFTPCTASPYTVSLKAAEKAYQPISAVFFQKNCAVDMTNGINSFPLIKGEPSEFLYQILVASYTPLPPSKVKQIYVIKGDADKFEDSQGQFTVDNSPFVLMNYTVGRVPSLYYKVKVEFADGTPNKVFDNVGLFQGGAYTLYVTEDADGLKLDILNDKGANAVTAYWQVIPYLVITFAEIPFSITGVAFAFSQAPASMKSIMAACWYLTSAFGNLIDLIVIQIQIPDKAIEFFLFAGLMFVVTIIFSIIAYFYKYVEDIEKEKQEADPEHHEHHMPHAQGMHASPTTPYIIDPPPQGYNDMEKPPMPPGTVIGFNVGTPSSGPQVYYYNPGVTSEEDLTTAF